MECQVCSERLTAYLDNELTASELEEIEIHLESCSHCREESEGLQRSAELVESQMSLLELAPPRWSGIESRISGSSRSFWDFRWLVAPGWAMAVATLLLLLIAVPMYYGASGEQADLNRMFLAFIAERDRQEMIHEGIFQAEPVGWVSYNPFVTRSNSGGRNPFTAE